MYFNLFKIDCTGSVPVNWSHLYVYMFQNKGCIKSTQNFTSFWALTDAIMHGILHVRNTILR